MQEPKQKRAPVTEFFFWPRGNAWENLEAALMAKPWIPEEYVFALQQICGGEHDLTTTPAAGPSPKF